MMVSHVVSASHGTNQLQFDDGKVTLYILFTSVMAASGGLIYGYDLVVAGGVSIMNDFLKMFYPMVYRNKMNSQESTYCQYDNQVYELFVSSLCLASLFATFVAAEVTKRLGHRKTMFIGGLLFIVASALGALATNLEMLILNRILLGCGLGFSNQAVPLYLSELAPAKHRGRLNLLFSLNLSIGILTGNIVNYVSSHIHPWGWRLSLGVNGIPAIFLALFSLFMVDTPSSLIAKNKYEEAKVVLKKIRGTSNIDIEFEGLLKARHETMAINHGEEVSSSFLAILKRRHRPQLVLGIAIPFFQQVAGYDALLFYGPSLFNSAGFGDNAALYSTVITGCVALLATITAISIVDRWGRRVVLLTATTLMFFFAGAISIILGLGLQDGARHLPRAEGILQVLFLCLFVYAYKASWGPLSWLIPSEIFSQDVRSAGQSITVCVNMLLKFAIAQSFLSMLCAFRFGIFLFFSGWLFIMGAFTFFFIPETKGISLDKMEALWENHWFWKRYYTNSKENFVQQEFRSIEMKA